MAEKFLPLKAMQRTVESARMDLKQLRDINDTLKANIDKVNDPQRFAPAHILKESGKLRSVAVDVSRGYLAAENTLGSLASVKAQASSWTTGQFLARAGGVADLGMMGESNVAKLLQKTNFLLAASRMPTPVLADIVQAAADREDWAILGLAYNECLFRKQQGDEAAATLAIGITTVPIPAIEEAKELMAEAAQLEEHLAYTSRSIENGEGDLGLQYEAAQQIREGRRAEQQHAREQVRQAVGNGRDMKPAA